MKKALLWAAVAVAALVLATAAAVWLTTYHPGTVQAEPVHCRADAPTLAGGGQTLSALTWNVQYMAGKGYVFWYDLADRSGPGERPSADAIRRTLAEVARVIREERPDIVLLQEVDDGARRTDQEDQLARLLELLGEEYACHTSAFYWKAAFVPHPRIFGPVGMKLSTLSRYRIDSATRYQLPLVPADPLTQAFSPRRALLEARLPVADGSQFIALNTHLEAWAEGTDVMERQVAQVDATLQRLTVEGTAWIIGGDFNLLPPGPQYANLSAGQRVYYRPESELAVLYDRYQAVPSLADANGPDGAAWFTHFPNDPTVGAPDQTIDYIFLSDELRVVDGYVRRFDTLEISDHLPVLARFVLP